MNNFPYPRLKRKAFSLLELLVATTVLALVMVLLSVVVSGTTNTSNRAKFNLLLSSDATFLLDLIEADLRAIQPGNSTSEWLRIENTESDFGAAGMTRNSELYFITRAADVGHHTNGTPIETDVGFSKAVRYALRFQSLLSPEESKRVGLFRTVAGASTEKGMGLTAFLDYLNTTNLAATWVEAPRIEDILTSNALNLQINLISILPDGSSVSLSPSASEIRFIGRRVLIDGEAVPTPPTGLEISLELIPSQLMRRAGDLSASGEFVNKRRAEGRIYSRFVPLTSH